MEWKHQKSQPAGLCEQWTTRDGAGRVGAVCRSHNGAWRVIIRDRWCLTIYSGRCENSLEKGKADVERLITALEDTLWRPRIARACRALGIKQTKKAIREYCGVSE